MIRAEHRLHLKREKREPFENFDNLTRWAKKLPKKRIILPTLLRYSYVIESEIFIHSVLEGSQYNKKQYPGRLPTQRLCEESNNFLYLHFWLVVVLGNHILCIYQSKTFELVGIDLWKECFNHGQLYVGLSRIGAADNQSILLPQNKTISNIVYREALTQ